MSLRLDWATYKSAKYAVEHWHYSKTMPVNKTTRFGVWENKKFVGCLIFSCGAAGVRSIGKSLNLENMQVCELARIALTKHNFTVSKMLSIAMKMLKKSQPRLRLIVSYADPEQGHLGGIYQAGNWIYVGESARTIFYIDKNRKKWHSRSLSESGYVVHCGIKKRCPKPSSMRKTLALPKYKYYMPLDKIMSKQIEPLRKPYPKRMPLEDFQRPVEDGGAIPTHTLQTQATING